MSDTTRSTMDASRTDVAGTTAIDETSDLIASDKVEGTAVYNRAGERLGTVHNFMVGKRSGKVAYAVMSFGGFLGIGESYHPLPWDVLTYDPAQGGYVVNLSREQLEGGPRYSASEAPDWTNPEYGSRIRDHYGVPVSTMTP
jgi:hypothetical protein